MSTFGRERWRGSFRQSTGKKERGATGAKQKLRHRCSAKNAAMKTIPADRREDRQPGRSFATSSGTARRTGDAHTGDAHSRDTSNHTWRPSPAVAKSAAAMPKFAARNAGQQPTRAPTRRANAPASSSEKITANSWWPGTERSSVGSFQQCKSIAIGRKPPQGSRHGPKRSIRPRHAQNARTGLVFW
jgi:hypothetical protein